MGCGLAGGVDLTGAGMMREGVGIDFDGKARAIARDGDVRARHDRKVERFAVNQGR
jgi:hypothetical protein